MTKQNIGDCRYIMIGLFTSSKKTSSLSSILIHYNETRRETGTNDTKAEELYRGKSWLDKILTIQIGTVVEMNKNARLYICIVFTVL